MAKQNNDLKHEFAFYLPETTELVGSHRTKEPFSLNNPQLYHRITNVVRLSVGELFILFDQTHHAQCQLNTTEKKNIINLTIISVATNQILRPTITFLLPLLKREAFQEAIYSCAELGATTIAPIITQKAAHRPWGGSHELERLERIIYAAAEQSKNFAFPAITDPKPLEQTLIMLGPTTHRFYFDPDGQPLLPTLQKVKKKTAKEVVLMIGPEADLTTEEKNLVQKHNFIFCRLTPTILRAQQAAAISLGAFRSLLN